MTGLPLGRRIADSPPLEGHRMPLIRFVRLVGTAIGSLVAAGLVLGLVSGFLPVPIASVSGVLTIALGGLIYADIRRRDRPTA